MTEKNNLTDQERELFYIVQEECAEVIQMISKILRFGFNEEFKNQERLTQEVGDLVACITLLYASGIVDKQEVELAVENKLLKLKRWSKLFKKEEDGTF
jgi:NTP pyrophosphatase (non-canonical NTP hydrolase)